MLEIFSVEKEKRERKGDFRTRPINIVIYRTMHEFTLWIKHRKQTEDSHRLDKYFFSTVYAMQNFLQ